MTPGRAQVAVVYLAGLAQGLALVTVPAAGAIFTDPNGYHLTSSQYGSLFVPMVILAIAGSTLGARAARRGGLKPVFVTGLWLNLASMIALTVSEWFVAWPGIAYGVLLGATAALGAGFGTTLMALNAYVAEFYPDRSTAALPALHAFLGTGTALAPVLVAVSVAAVAWWLLPLAVAAGFLALGLAGALAPLATPPHWERAREGSPPPARRRIPLRLLVYAGAVFAYGVCETVFGNWATLYLHGEARLPLGQAELALTAFWAMVTTGRVATALISPWVDARRIYVTLPVLITIAFLGIPRVGGTAVGAVLAFAFAGVGCSAFFPLSISLAEQEFRQAAAGVSGGLVAAYMLGYGVGAFAVGPVKDVAHMALSAVYASTSVLAAGMAAAALLLAWPRRRQGAGVVDAGA